MIEVLKQMIEALETRICSCCYESEICCAPAIKNAIQAGRQAIAELESQEPVACGTYQEVTDTMNALWAGTLEQVQIAEEMKNKKLYTAPPQRTWVGLTDEEVNNAIKEKNITPLFTYRMIARAIEAKLKEKNT